MDIPGHIFKGYDIRAIYPTEMDEKSIVPITQAIVEFIKENKKVDRPLKIAVGQDMRTSSPSLFEVVTKTIAGMGQDVIDIGLASTPTFYFAVDHYSFDGGIQVSASHNPKEYNGLKIAVKVENGIMKVGKSTGLEDIKERALQIAAEGYKANDVQPGTITKQDGVLKDEVENAIQLTGNPEIKPFKIVADAANAMGGTYIEELFKKIPGELIKMNFELDGTFPAHQPDPLQKETLVDLQKKVVEEQADLGLAPDGDGDRLFFIDEKGGIIPASTTTALVARELLKKNPGEEILFDIRYIMTPQKIVQENGGKSEITKVGHAFITEKMQQTGAIFGGESSGHYFFRETGNAESQVPVILLVLEAMTREGKKLSEIVAELKRSNESGEINFKVKNAPEILAKLKEKYHDAEISELDGVAMTYPTWRFSVRTSNTEPLLRLNVEQDLSDSENRTQELVDFIKEVAIEDTPEH